MATARDSATISGMSSWTEIFYTLEERRERVENWRSEYNGVRSYNTFGYVASTPETVTCIPVLVVLPGGAGS